MKKVLLLALISFALSANSFAQKYAFIDVEYILSNMPEYSQAQKKIDDLAETYQSEVKAKYSDIDKKTSELKKEEMILPAAAIQKRQQEIEQLKIEAQQLQQKRFGVNGDLFKKRQELIEPIQTKIFKEVKSMCDDKGYDFVLDKGKQSNIIFVNAKYDKSDYIIKKLKE